MLRCKFRATQVKEVTGFYYRVNAPEEFHQVELELTAVSGPENAPWSKYTPSGKLTLTISNPEAFHEIIAGQDYYLDITPVPNGEN